MNAYLKKLWIAALVLIIVGFSIFPFYYAVITSMKTGAALYEVDILPKSFRLDNYRFVLRDENFLRSILNSVFVASATVIFALFLSVTAAYSLSRVRFRGRRLLLLCILSVSFFPQVAVLAGLFELISFLGLHNTPYALIISYTIFIMPFIVWVMTAFMRDLPIEVEEAAIVDGATTWQIITRVFLPLLWPALAATGLLAFIAAWNEFLFALTFSSAAQSRTVPVAIALLSGNSEFEIPWGVIMAASVLVTVPLIILVLIFQRRIVAGLTAGAVKG